MRASPCVFLCLVAMAGCVTSTPYPGAWPQTIAARPSQCPSLTGSYENYGLTHDGNRVELAGVFFNGQPPTGSLNYSEVLAVSHVTFDDRDDDGLVVKAWVGDELLSERLLSPERLPCIEGRRIYKATDWDARGVMTLPFVAYSWVDRSISETTEGSLVIENKDFGVGWAGLFPMAGGGQSWYSFSKTSADSPGLHTLSDGPRGVRIGPAHVARLRPPPGDPKPGFFDGYMNSKAYQDAQTCVDLAVGAKDSTEPPELALLEGRSTQAFLLQDGREGTLATQNGNFGKRNTAWVPGTHKLRIEKLHWQPPAVTDRYAICLLKKGYRWDSSE